MTLTLFMTMTSDKSNQVKLMSRQTDRHTHRQTHTDRQTDRHTDTTKTLLKIEYSTINNPIYVMVTRLWIYPCKHWSSKLRHYRTHSIYSSHVALEYSPFQSVSRR